MFRFEIVRTFEAATDTAQSADALKHALVQAKRAMGFDYVALTHHANPGDGTRTMIRVHDYPQAWVDQFDARKLGRADPVHRASHVENYVFPWRALHRMIPMEQRDWQIFETAQTFNIGEGYTVPFHIPGETSGSVSFAVRTGHSLPDAMLPILPAIAGLAVRCARRLTPMRPPPRRFPILTAAQMNCLRWMMRGKTDWEASRIVGCGEYTVKRHIMNACDRYGVDKRPLLLARTLLDGTLSLADVYEYR